MDFGEFEERSGLTIIKTFCNPTTINGNGIGLILSYIHIYSTTELTIFGRKFGQLQRWVTKGEVKENLPLMHKMVAINMLIRATASVMPCTKNNVKNGFSNRVFPLPKS